MKTRASVKTRCPFCQIIKRNKGPKLDKKGRIKKAVIPTIYVYCKKNRKHNQRQG